MYWALLKQGFGRWRRNLWHATLMRSGLITVLILTLVLVGLAFVWHEHRLGQFAQLKRDLRKKPPPDVSVRPGGQDVIQLRRSQLFGGNSPEFLSATLLPGRGMNILQISAYVPQKGEVSLLASPSLEDAAKLLSGAGADANGANSLALGAAIEIPWASRMTGAVSPDGESLIAAWRGIRFTLPTEPKERAGTGNPMADGGLLLKRSSEPVTTNVMPDGGETQAIFHAGDFEGRWPSKSDVTTTVALSGKALDLKIVVRNVGDIAEPIGIGWRPRFAIPAGQRGQMMLRLPPGQRVEVKDRRTGQLSGRLLPVEKTEYDFTARTGARLGALSLDDTFVHLKTGLMEGGPIAELSDPENDFGLRITAMTPMIKAMRVYAPLDGSFISIEPEFNYDDPFGREWAKDEDTGMVILQPGQSIQYKVRLEIFSLSSTQGQHL
jgi:aldose 1-epimerase